MTRVSIFLGATLAVGGWLTIGSMSLHAQDEEPEGIIRITDCPNGQLPADAASCPDAGYVSGCPSEACPGAPCGYGHGCHRRCHCGRCIHGFLSWLNPHGACTVSPDHGWAPPGKVALWRRGVAYNKFFPDAWTGQPVVAPAVRVGHVYMPTDTTQLGYYYQHVPYWRPNWAMIPPAPNPHQWHRPLCGPDGVCGVNAEFVGGSIIGEGCPVPAESSDEPQEEAPIPPSPEEAVETSTDADLQKSSDAPELQPTPGQSAN
jgi:hypothetical protein